MKHSLRETIKEYDTWTAKAIRMARQEMPDKELRDTRGASYSAHFYAVGLFRAFVRVDATWPNPTQSDLEATKTISHCITFDALQSIE